MLVRDETGSASVGAALEAAVASWNEATPDLQLRLGPGTGSGCRGDAGEIQVCLTESTEYAGHARRSDVGGHISGAVVMIDVRRSGPNVHAVACHELGHALGLGHRDEGSTCMRVAPVVDRPDQADLDRVRAAHEDTCRTRGLIEHNGNCVLG